MSAILFADIAGYTKLMEADEAGTYVEWRSARRDVIEPAVAEHKGRIVDYTGDGFLADFGSVEGALACAIAIQRRFSARQSLSLRMGLHIGEVYAEGDDIYGESVNLAARLEGFAEEGGICVSEAVYSLVEGKVPAGFEDCGKQTFKNVENPVRVWRVVIPDDSTDERDQGIEEGAEAARAKPSIVVLPFDNMSNDPEQEYFADGLVEDITTELSRIRWMDVVARNSAFTYKGRSVDIRQVGSELNVDYALEGSVRKLDGNLRITAQLVETGSGRHSWADKFDGALDKIFDILDDVTAGVVGAIEPSVLRDEMERAKRKRPGSLDAFDLYLRALSHSYRYTVEGRETARPLLERALSLEPDYAEAHGLAAMLAMQSYVWEGRNPADKEAAVTHAQAVRELGAEDATALAHGAWVFASVGGDNDTAMDLVERAIEINPNSVEACTWGAFIHLTKRSSARALGLAERALKLSPLDPQRHLTLHAVATAMLYLDNVDDALTAAEQALRSNPNYLPAYLVLISALVRQERLKDARAAMSRFREIAPDTNVEELAETFGFLAHIDEIVDAMRAAGLPE